jgi:hypothetical protein
MGPKISDFEFVRLQPSEKKHKKILDNLSKFIDNKDYIFQIKD